MKIRNRLLLSSEDWAATMVFFFCLVFWVSLSQGKEFLCVVEMRGRKREENDGGMEWEYLDGVRGVI